ncbi:hypothetical protein VPHD63_0047 [Vibrio phage D63]
MNLHQAMRIAVDILSANENSQDITTAQRLEAAQVIEQSRTDKIMEMNRRRTNWHPVPNRTK